jgi:hypothetical protein
MLKGGVVTKALIGVDCHGGWGFNDIREKGYGRNTKPEKANALPDEKLRTTPFYKPFRAYGAFARNALYGKDGSAAALDPETRARLFGEALPCLSQAAGRNLIGGQWDKDHSTDMMHEFMETGRWPEWRQRHIDTRNRWLHGDFRDVGYFFNHALYADIVQKGGLK